MEKKTAKSETHLPILPEDLIVERILPRLPVKSLIRFKSVSKYWFSTISSHKFEKTHLKYSSSCPQVIMIEDDYFDAKNYVLSLDNECSNVKELVEFECKYPVMIASPRHSTRVIGSNNGLVCLFDEVFCFYLWNPATHQCCNVGSPYFDYPFPADTTGAGFGYISSIDDYRIGCIIWSCDDEVHVYVFSLRAGKWNRTANIDENYHFTLERAGVSVSIDDTIYWPPEVLDGGKGVESHILGLNLVSGQLNKIPLNNVVSGYDKVDVFRMEGCLSLCCISYLNGDRDVWMLKQYDDCTSWEKIFSLNIRGESLLYLFEMGKCLVGNFLEELKLLDPGMVALEECEEGNVIWQGSEKNKYTLVTDAWGYVESLISPFGTTKYDEGEDDDEIKE